ncbi:MAG TPA: carboxypeptidase regulatory-like domain-containing protein [Candidatus Kapabacteria bacterium]|nr:carboxypeptidase regulatory-like domain-containing protein [Candidatus Kapabacteria bacterium]
MNTSIVRKLSYFLSMMLVVALISCGGKKTEEDETGEDKEGAAATTNAVYPDPNGGTISGTVKLDGAAPANKAIAMDADPVCKSAHAKPAMEDHWVVGDGGVLANAFVYIKDGLGGKTYAPVGGDVTLDQHGCQYEPHVFGVMVGQKIIVKNSDQTLHNIHAHGEKNEQFNEGQPAGSPNKEKTMDKVEVMVPIKCDVHGWMNCYAGVLNHPFFAVTKADGKFEIKGVPPGDYTVTVWHETLDGKGVSVDQKVTVAAKDSKTVDFAVKAQ